MRLRKDVADELLLSAGVWAMDPTIGILASQAGMLLNRSKTRMDSDRRDSKPPPAYKDRSKVLYRLGDVLTARARDQGKTLEQAARDAADAKRGWPSFSDFVDEKDQAATWPISTVQGFPVNFFDTLAMDLEEEDLGEAQDLTAQEFIDRRVAFYKERPSGWGVAPTEQAKKWASVFKMATSLSEGWDRGYQQAIVILNDETKVKGRSEKAATKRKREELEHTGDYRGVRKALDAAPDSLYMSRFTAQFYLGMSPGTFKQALARGPHPFEGLRGGATKGDVDKWFSTTVLAKHADIMPTFKIKSLSRDLSSGRPYLVDISGTILADGDISNIDPADVAYAASMGAGMRILSLDTALESPWRSTVEREAWGVVRRSWLQENLEAAQNALTRASQQDLQLNTPKAQGPKRPRGGL